MRGRAAVAVAAMSMREQGGSVLGGGRGATYIGFRDGVISLTEPGLPRMPNGIQLHRLPSCVPAPGTPGFLRSGVLRVGELVVEWDESDTYDLRIDLRESPALPSPEPFPLENPSLLSDLTHLVQALVDGDNAETSLSAGRLIGRGPGLTPAGDDLVVGVLAALHAVAPETVREVAFPDLDVRTTALSATLLRLATQGRVVEPLLRWLSMDGSTKPRAAWELDNMGSSTGRCYRWGATRAFEAAWPIARGSKATIRERE